MELLHHIRDEILGSAAGAVPFCRFMELALYHPRLGYYTSARAKVGKEGDFYTSATVHPVFAETLADVALEMWEKTGMTEPVLVEAGGGTGSLVRHIAERIRTAAPRWYSRMRLVLVEASPYHRELQQQALADCSCPKTWYATIEEAAAAERVEGVLLSNEWLDAFPVHILEKRADGWHEVGVTWDEESGSLKEVLLPALSEAVADYLAEAEPHVEAGSRIEVNLGMKAAITAVARLLKRGYVITIDYGDEEEQLYHPSRKRGTLMCYRRHQAHDNPYIYVGEQDMTAHVNFSALRRWGEAVGLLRVAYMRQDQFLLRSGILTKLTEHQDRDPFTSEAMRRNRAIRQLISPEGMGGVFRVLVQAKGVPADVPLRFLHNASFWT
jgi:SAM-dependent MidA family methyltransferase